jgi:hypothetical protein
MSLERHECCRKKQAESTPSNLVLASDESRILLACPIPRWSSSTCLRFKFKEGFFESGIACFHLYDASDLGAHPRNVTAASVRSTFRGVSAAPQAAETTHASHLRRISSKRRGCRQSTRSQNRSVVFFEIAPVQQGLLIDDAVKINCNLHAPVCQSVSDPP